MKDKINSSNYEIYLLDYFDKQLSETEVDELKQFALMHPEFAIDLELELPSLNKTQISYTDKNNLRKEFTLTEETLLNYLENNLSKEAKVEFELQLSNNTALKNEFNGYQKTFLNVEHHPSFLFKTNLLKNEEEYLLNTASLRYLEGEMNEEEKIDFEKSCSENIDLKQNYNAYLATLIFPDLDIVFENKALLKKESTLFIVYRNRIFYAAAAAITLFFVFNFVVGLFTSNNNFEVPKLSDSKKPTQIIKNKPEVALNSKNNIHSNKASINNTRRILKTNSVISTVTLEPEQKPSAENSSLAVVETQGPLKVQTKITAADTFIKNNPTLSEAEDKALANLERIYLIPFEEDLEDSDENVEQSTKHKFWKKLTKLASKANELGIKSINGTEEGNQHYLLSFNAMSIEKK